MEDTIAAIATPFGAGGLAVLRISGPNAFHVASQIFVSADGSSATEYPSHTIHFGRIVKEGHTVDQVLLSVMRAPRSYTTEDTIEISCHGGMLVARTILSLCIESGARLAEPGEFTKRAFINGRIDLTQAEAVMDIISAKTERAHAAAMRAMEGHLYHKICAMRNSVLDILATVEAHIDFPEEDIPADVLQNLTSSLRKIRAELQNLLRTANEGRIFRQGVSVVIIGRPNVGKSSLLNALLRHDRAIVSHTPGTTRDTIEEAANVRGIPVTFIDTAGIRSSIRSVESKGISRTHKAISSSNIMLYVLDNSKRFTESDRQLICTCQSKPHLIIINKIDLPNRLIIPKNIAFTNIINVSAKSGEGIDALESGIESKILSKTGQIFDDGYTINERQAAVLTGALRAINEILSAVPNTLPIEVLAQTLKVAMDSLGELIGKTTTEDLLQRIFGAFCIGK